MKRQMIERALRGFPLGVAIGYLLSILSSLHIGDGNYYACDPTLMTALGGELNAVIVQAVCMGVIGSAFAGGSVVWEIDSWNLAQQSAVYFAISALVMMPISYLMNWMDHSVGGFLSYLLVFTLIWLAFWLVQYLVLRSKIKKMNEEVM